MLGRGARRVCRGARPWAQGRGAPADRDGPRQPGAGRPGRGEAQVARGLADEILTLLAAGQPASVYEPPRTYQTCYRALAACADQRAADVLHTAHTIVMQQAAWIAEPDWRRSFLENVAVHRALIAEAARLGLEVHTAEVLL